ncbi:MAG: M20/M25/M40 family metallo-hydrolase [Gemmatimonadales bacterium]|nr:MAG: M20/M25/M40 family metallo-hydrolase [Gemmatimonadales bacterium]
MTVWAWVNGIGVAVALLAQPLGAQGRLAGFSPSASVEERALEAELARVPDSASARSHSRVLASSAHVAGTPAQRRTADYVLEHMAQWGLDTSRVEFRVFLPFHDSTVVELVAPERVRLVLEEAAEPSDSATLDGIWPAMNGYSGSGDVTAAVVYVNYGLPEDYAALDSMGVPVEGRVVLARYGRSFRGIKAREAERNGAAALLLYSDPQDDGYFRGDVYPFGPMRPESAVQRGSLFNDRGDPSTPGWPSTDGAHRLPRDSMELPRIPVVPLSHGNAARLLRPLDGPSVPQAWQGGLPFRYHVGAGNVVARVAVWPEEGERAYKTIVNTFGTIRGAEWPDELVITGGHRDAWGPGAADNVSGIVSILEAARAWGEAAARGHPPRRTLIFATWDAEEWALVGSVEWVELMAERLQEQAVAYINQDVAAIGRNFGAAGTASLHPFIRDVAAMVGQPGDTVSVYQGWRTAQELDDTADVRIGDLGGGSDFAGFYNHLGIPSLGFGFGGPYGVYHAAYDSYRWMERFGDTDFTSHAAAGRVLAIMLGRLANASVVPFDYMAFGRYLSDLVERTATAHEAIDWAAPALDRLGRAASHFTARGTSFDETRARALTAESGAPVSPSVLAEVNTMLRKVERDLTRAEGLAGRPWMRNLVFAADRNNGYADIAFPAVTEALEDGDRAQAEAEIDEMIARIGRAGVHLEAARTLLEKGR